jgi:hypothetical protein
MLLVSVDDISTPWVIACMLVVTTYRVFNVQLTRCVVVRYVVVVVLCWLTGVFVRGQSSCVIGIDRVTAIE